MPTNKDIDFLQYKVEFWLNTLKKQDKPQITNNIKDMQVAPVLQEKLVNDEQQVSIITKLSKEPKISFAEIDLLIASEDYESLNNLDQKLLTKYFSWNKIKKQEQQIQQLNNTDTTITWYTDKGTFNSKNPAIVQIDKNYYGIIEEKLANKLDSTIFAKFLSALNKGFAVGESDGIKKLSTLLELKIHEDARLFTDTIFFSANKYLIIFNKVTNHAGIKDAITASNNITYINSEIPSNLLSDNLENERNIDSDIITYLEKPLTSIGDTINHQNDFEF